MRLFGFTILTEPATPASPVVPWYLRPVPRPVALAFLSLLALLASPVLLLFAAVFLGAVSHLVLTTGRGFVCVLFPRSAFAPHPAHVALAVVIGVALWTLLLLTMARVVRWFTYSCSPDRLGPGPKPAAVHEGPAAGCDGSGSSVAAEPARQT